MSSYPIVLGENGDINAVGTGNRFGNVARKSLNFMITGDKEHDQYYIRQEGHGLARSASKLIYWSQVENPIYH